MRHGVAASVWKIRTSISCSKSLTRASRVAGVTVGSVPVITVHPYIFASAQTSPVFPGAKPGFPGVGWHDSIIFPVLATRNRDFLGDRVCGELSVVVCVQVKAGAGQ